MPLIELTVTVDVQDVNAETDADCVTYEVAQEIAKAAVTEALEFAESQGVLKARNFNIGVDSVEAD